MAHQSAAEQRNQRVPTGGQLELPMKGDVLKSPGSYRRPGPSREDRLAAGEHPVSVYHGGNYPLMMTGPEIRRQFQALDGDREPSNDYEGPEHDDEVYDRKYEEAWSPETSWVHGSGVGDRINKHGYDMTHPVSLSSGKSKGSYLDVTGQRGSQGRYQVLGGHHRVAVMSTDFPDELMSVQWHRDIGAARNSPSY